MINTNLPSQTHGRHNYQTANLNSRNNINNNNNNHNNNQQNNFNQIDNQFSFNREQIYQSSTHHNSPIQPHALLIHTRPSPYNNRFAMLRSSPALANTSKTIS